MNFEIRDTLSLSDLFNTFGTIYAKDLNRSVWCRSESSRGTFRTVDLTNAWASGKTCTEHVVEGEWTAKGDVTAILSGFLYRFPTIPAVVAFLETLPWEKHYGSERVINHPEFPGLAFHRNHHKGTRTWSPFTKPAALKSEPAKWTIPHTLRALANGQFESLKCDGRYTDDYAFDAADNFGRREIKRADCFVRTIMESPSGWHTYGSGGFVHVNCHSFDCNSFRLVLNPPASVPEYAPAVTIAEEVTDKPVAIAA